MRVLALDLSTSSGVALFNGSELVFFDSYIRKVNGKEKLDDGYPFNYLAMAENMAKYLVGVCISLAPDMIVIEETNKGRNRYHQKQLEFIHAFLISEIWSNSIRAKVHYMDTSAWRRLLGMKLSNDQRKNNKDVKKLREDQKDKLRQSIILEDKSILDERLSGVKLKRELNKISKAFEKEVEAKVSKAMRSFRTPSSKIDFKKLSVNYVNEHFNKEFKMKDNDITDAICVGQAFIQNNYSCII